MTKKYEFTGETRIVEGVTVHRIRALIEMSGVKVGDLGGWIEREANLSHDGDAWVCDEACVYGDAWVYGNACVSGDAWVYDNAQVYENAWVSGKAWVSGCAWVCDYARVLGDSWVFGNACVRDFARVFDEAWVCGDAWVSDYARVSGDARVFGNARVLGDSWVHGNALVSGEGPTPADMLSGCDLTHPLEEARQEIDGADAEEDSDAHDAADMGFLDGVAIAFVVGGDADAYHSLADFACASYNVADAMLAERKRRYGK